MLKKITESSATIWAALIGGVFAVSSAVLPGLLDRKPVESTPASTPGAVSAAAVAPPALAVPLIPNFTYGTWTLHAAVDAEGNVWDNSTLKFTQQHATADGLQLVGYFEWRTDNALQGREQFVGNYIAVSRQVFIEGRQIEDAVSPQLGVGSFSAKLDEEARSLVEGRWGTPAGNLANVPGSWSARR